MRDCTRIRDRVTDYLENALDQGEREVVQRHLAGCPACAKFRDEIRQTSALLGTLRSAALSPESEERLMGLYREWHSASDSISPARTSVGQLATWPPEEFKSRTPAEQLATVRASSHFHNQDFVDRALAAYLREVFNDPEAAGHWAQLALAAIQRFDLTVHDSRLVADLKARALTSLGNAYRASSKHAEAERAFAEAEKYLTSGTGSLLERARHCHLKGVLRNAQRRFVEAAALYDRAISIYQQVGDGHLEGRVLSDKSSMVSIMGDPEGAIALRSKAIEMLDTQREPRLLVVAEHNMIDDLVNAGRLTEALGRLQRLRPMYQTLGEALTLVRLRWVEGKLACRMGDIRLAEEAFIEVRRTFIERGIPYDAAIVCLELATLYAEQGRTAEMKQLAAEILPIFKSLGIHREAIAALLVFKQAAEMEAVTAALLAELGVYFQRASKDPTLPFRPAGTGPAIRPVERRPVALPVCDQATVLTRERAVAVAMLEEIRRHPHQRRLTLVGNTKRFQTWGFVELLLEAYWQEIFGDTQAASEWAETALLAAERLDPEAYGAALVADLRARAATSFGNARRACSDHATAERALRQAEQYLALGTGDPVEQARLFHLEGLLRKAEHRFAEARSLFGHARQLYQREGDNHQQGKVLLDEANLLSNMGDRQEAMALRRAAMDMLDYQREPRSAVVAEHNMIDDLVELGLVEEARTRLERLRPMYAALGEGLTLVHLSWIEGKLACQLGELQVAETSFCKVRQDFVDRGVPYDVALVSLDLATVYAQQGRTADMKRLAGEMLPIFQSLGIHREAIAAVLVFQQAAEMEAVTAGLIQELACYFQRASKEPALRFREPAG